MGALHGTKKEEKQMRGNPNCCRNARTRPIVFNPPNNCCRQARLRPSTAPNMRQPHLQKCCDDFCKKVSANHARAPPLAHLGGVAGILSRNLGGAGSAYTFALWWVAFSFLMIFVTLGIHLLFSGSIAQRVVGLLMTIFMASVQLLITFFGLICTDICRRNKEN